MALQKQTIEVPLSGGLETKLDPKVVQPGSTLVLENAEFSETGAITKRNGFTRLARDTMSGGTVTKARTLHNYKDAMVMHDGDSLLVWEPSQAKWLNAGTLIGVSVETGALPLLHSSVATPSALPLAAQMCMANGVIVYAYRNIAGNIVGGVIDATTKAVLLAPTSLGAGVAKVRMAVSGGMVLIAWQDSGNNIDLAYIDTSSAPTAFSTRLNALSSVATDGGIDLAASYGNNGSFVLVYETTTGPAIAVRLLTATANSISTTIAEDPNARDIGVVVSAAGSIYVAWNNNATNRPRAAILNQNLSVASAAADLSTTQESTQFCGVEESTNVVRWVYSVIVTGSTRNVASNTITSAGAIGTEATVVGSAFVVSKPWVYNSRTYLVCGFDDLGGTDIAQSGYFLVTTDGVIAARHLQGAAYPGTSAVYPVPSNVIAYDDEVYYAGHAFFSSSALLLDAYYPQPGFAVFDFSARATAVEFGDSLVLATGGMVHEFDGASLRENNFFAYPAFSLTASNGSGSLALGTYQVAACYAALDSNGQIQFGPAAPAQSITLAGAEDTITVLVWNLRMTNRATASSWILIYMTDLAGSVFYEVKSLANDKTATRQSVDLLTVTGITDNRTIYTTGGLLENGAPPALKNLIRVGKRLYGMAQDGVINYTKEHVDGEGASFSPEVMVRQLSSGSGEEFALAEMDGRLVAIGEHSVQVLTGEGLDDAGANNTLSAPQNITTDDGAVAGAPVAITPAGIFYRSAKGIGLLDRSLAVQFIGAPVEDYRDLETVSAVVVSSKNQVVFGHSDGETLVYDYHVSRWSVFDNHEQSDAIAHGGVYSLAKADGQVWQKSSGFVDGDEQPIALTVRTPWVKLSGLQGFQRLYYASVIGEWRSAHKLNVSVYYDYATAPSETVAIELAGMSPGDPLQVRHHLGRKCQSVMFEIWDSDQAGTKESLKLTSLALEVGVKQGVRKQSRSQTA